MPRSRHVDIIVAYSSPHGAAMPDVVLTRREVRGRLPEVCMCCGAPATTRITREFLARDPEVKGPSGFLEVFAVRLLLAAANTPRLRLRTTFCDQHSNYWWLRTALLFGGIAGLVAILALGFLSVVLLITVGKVDAPWLSCCVIAPMLLYLPAWTIPAMRLGKTSIRARLAEDGEDGDVLLTNVCEQYAAAVLAARRHPPPLPPPLPDSHKRPSGGE